MMVDSFPESELILLVLESENETLYANKPEIQIWLDFEDKPLYIHVQHMLEWRSKKKFHLNYCPNPNRTIFEAQDMLISALC